MIVSGSVLTKPLVMSQAGLSLRGVSLGGFPSTLWLYRSLTLSKSFCSLSVFSSRSLSLSCCAFSCFSSCFFFDSAMVLSKTWKQITHLFLFPPYQQCPKQLYTLIATKACFDVLGGNLKRKRSDFVSGLVTLRLLG